MCLTNVVEGAGNSMKNMTDGFANFAAAGMSGDSNKQTDANQSNTANSLYSDVKLKNDSTNNNQGLGDNRRAGAMGIASTRAALMAQEKVRAVKQTLGA